jgi:hypothetical protein
MAGHALSKVFKGHLRWSDGLWYNFIASWSVSWSVYYEDHYILIGLKLKRIIYSTEPKYIAAIICRKRPAKGAPPVFNQTNKTPPLSQLQPAFTHKIL